MRDPVTGFEYPASWQQKVTDPRELDPVGQGFAGTDRIGYHPPARVYDRDHGRCRMQGGDPLALP